MAWCWDDFKKENKNNGGFGCGWITSAFVNPIGDSPAVKKAKERVLVDYSKVCFGCNKEFSVSDPDTLTEFRCEHNHVMHTECVKKLFHLTFMKSIFKPKMPKCPCCKDVLKA